MQHPIFERIAEIGSVSIADFMQEVLYHPKYGYYMTQDPFNRKGDFITAPEISQMFGEMLGAWCAWQWQALGEPDSVRLIECGPGRGTLMVDMLRASKHVPGFHDALTVAMVEISPKLRSIQQQALAVYSDTIVINWIDDIADITGDVPCIVVANEFLDAFPIMQYVKQKAGWVERRVSIDTKGVLAFVEVATPLAATLASDYPNAPVGAVVELSPATQNYFGKMVELVASSGGTGLVIDYGYDRLGDYANTLQALYKHQKVPVFEHLSHADITAHVDFTSLVAILEAMQVPYAVPLGQGAFLETLGIEARAEQLQKRASEKQVADIQLALDRLCAVDKMGDLFKVLVFGNFPS